jgi:hypothetical protein
MHVADSVVDVPCGEGLQRAKWAAQVAIARYDPVSSKGFMQLGACVGWINRIKNRNLDVVLRVHYYRGTQAAVQAVTTTRSAL